MKGFITLIAGALFSALPAAADIYRWQGNDGSVHFGDEPPPDRQAVPLYEHRTWEPKPAAGNASGLRPGERRALEQSRRRVRTTAPKSAPSERKQSRSARKVRCLEARDRLEALSGDLRRGYTAARGARLKRSRKKLEAWVFDNCETRWR